MNSQSNCQVDEEKGRDRGAKRYWEAAAAAANADERSQDSFVGSGFIKIIISTITRRRLEV